MFSSMSPKSSTWTCGSLAISQASCSAPWVSTSTCTGISRPIFFFAPTELMYAIISATCAAEVDLGSVMYASALPAPATRMSKSFFQCACV